ncbi:hypothetical protein KCU77_g71, partial [Aureobasidium melanogenum]
MQKTFTCIKLYTVFEGMGSYHTPLQLEVSLCAVASAEFVHGSIMSSHLSQVDTMSWPQISNDIHDQCLRTREDCIIVFVDMNNVTAWCGARVRLSSSASRVIGWA